MSQNTSLCCRIGLIVWRILTIIVFFILRVMDLGLGSLRENSTYNLGLFVLLFFVTISSDIFIKKKSHILSITFISHQSKSKEGNEFKRTKLKGVFLFILLILSFCVICSLLIVTKKLDKVYKYCRVPKFFCDKIQRAFL